MIMQSSLTKGKGNRRIYVSVKQKKKSTRENNIQLSVFGSRQAGSQME